MFNVIGSIVQKRHYLTVEEANVMDALKAIDEIKRSSRIHKVMNMELGNCGWKDEPATWFINFDVTDNQWKKIMGILRDTGYQIVLREDDRLYLTKNKK